MNQRNLVLVRHGQSEWNAKNLFTGWEDPGLTPKGALEAKKAGVVIKNLGISFDLIFTSALIRAQLTGSIILDEIGIEVPTIQNVALNERYYGDLQGLNKDECRKKWGEEKVRIWRRSYNSGPPGGESLKDTSDRVLPYYLDKIHSLILSGKNILIAAHGNSLRSLVKHLDKISEKEIVELEIPTGAPIHYLFDKNGEVIKKKNLI